MATLFTAWKSKKTPAQCKDTGLALILLFLLALLGSKNIVFLFPTLSVLLLTMTWPQLLQPVAVVWFGLAELMSAVMGKIFLTLIFICIVTPHGILRQRAGRDAMGLQGWKRSTASIFTIRDHRFTPADLKNPY